MARTMVARAAGYTSDVEFSPMDATRSDRDYVYQMLSECIDAGATTVNIPDTVGYTMPEEFEQFIRDIQENVPNIDKARISVHCHNDLGLAVANTLAAVQAGAASGRELRQRHRRARGQRRPRRGRDGHPHAPRLLRPPRPTSTRGSCTAPAASCRDLTGMSVQPNKAIVGANAFRHQSGIHQDGVLKMRETYEIMDAAEIGLERGSVRSCWARSRAAHGLKSRLEELGYELTEEELSRVFLAFKELADKKGEIDDRDLESLVADEMRESAGALPPGVRPRVNRRPRAARRPASVSSRPTAIILADAALGTGPVDAVCQAINRIVGVPNELTEFSVKSVTEGIDAQGEVTIRIESDGRTYVGRGADTDIIVASAKAYMNALNRMLATHERHQPVEVETTP